MSDVPFYVLDVPVEGPSCDEVLDHVKKAKNPVWIVTLNPEMLVAAARRPEYKKTLQQADLRTIDGFGLWMFVRRHRPSVHRVTGVELSERFMQQAQQEGWKVGCFGGVPGTARQLREVLAKRFPGVSVHVEEAGYVDQNGVGDGASEEALHRTTLFAPDVLFVALGGGGTKQERWILQNMAQFPRLRAIMGIGGTFDYWMGRMKRAPSWMQKRGLEWLWRLCMQPSRVLRIWNAVIVFPWLVLKERSKKK